MNINSVTLSGNLTRDPELRQTQSGMSICSMRLAVNDRVKNANTGEWEDRPNYFDLSAFGGTADACAKWLQRGAKVLVHGKLRWREWEAQDGGKRQAVSVAVDAIEFPPRSDGQYQGGSTAAGSASTAAGTATNAPESADYGDDDIPF